MKQLIALMLLTISVNALADNYGLTDTQQVKNERQANDVKDNPDGFASNEKDPT